MGGPKRSSFCTRASSQHSINSHSCRGAGADVETEKREREGGRPYTVTWSWMPHCVIPKQSRPVWHPIQETLQPALASLPSLPPSLRRTASSASDTKRHVRSMPLDRRTRTRTERRTDGAAAGLGPLGSLPTLVWFPSVRPSRRRRRRTRSVGRCISLLFGETCLSLSAFLGLTCVCVQSE